MMQATRPPSAPKILLIAREPIHPGAEAGYDRIESGTTSAPRKSTRSNGSFREADRPEPPLVPACPCYFCSPGAGRSELNMSATTFHWPSACFFQTSTNLPRSCALFIAS